MLDPAVQLAARRRPSGEPAMLQSWRHLGFFHFPADPEEIQATVPKGVQIDTFPDRNGIERAWVGVVAFGMERIRPVGLPALPWISAFLETNVRTYVHRDGAEPGVYFYSLDAARRLACDVARLTFGLNYLHSEMAMSVVDNTVEYSIRRFDEPHAHLDLEYSFDGEAKETTPGTFEFFCAERYVLYAERQGSLGLGRVWHPPYLVQQVTVSRLASTLIESLELNCGALEHAIYCPGTDVEVFPFEPIALH